jgi:phosphate starvation-inducible protein PhoH
MTKRVPKPDRDGGPRKNVVKRKPTMPIQLKLSDLNEFDPITENQKKFFELYDKGTYFTTLHGVAGTGKSFIAMYKAMEEVLDKKNSYDKIIIVRSAVPGRDQGFLPGDEDEKMSVFTAPYIQICHTLFGRKDAFKLLVDQGVIEFCSTSFNRGITLDDAIVIADEIQNFDFQEFDTTMTRVGYQTKIIWCGDYRQTDLNKNKHDVSGIIKFFDIVRRMGSYSRIEFTVDDIVRSELVKEYIVAKIQYEDEDTNTILVDSEDKRELLTG